MLIKWLLMKKTLVYITAVARVGIVYGRQVGIYVGSLYSVHMQWNHRIESLLCCDMMALRSENVSTTHPCLHGKSLRKYVYVIERTRIYDLKRRARIHGFYKVEEYTRKIFSSLLFVEKVVTHRKYMR